MVNSKAIISLTALAIALTGGVIYNSSLNITFDLILPDGTTISPILSSGNYTHVQNNVGIFTIPRASIHNTQQAPTMGYCPLAKLIHEHETPDYDKIHVGNGTIFTATIPPKWCDSELKPITIPEFGSFAGGITSIAVFSSIMIFAWYRRKQS